MLCGTQGSSRWRVPSLPINMFGMCSFFGRWYRKEFLNTLCCAFKVSVWKPWQFRKSMMGTSTPSYIEQFWNHCRTCEEWADHPVLQRGGDLGRTFSRLNVLKIFPNLILEAFISKAFQFGMLWGTRVAKVRTPTNHIALWWCRVLSQFWIFSLELVPSDGFWCWHSTLYGKIFLILFTNSPCHLKRF